MNTIELTATSTPAAETTVIGSQTGWLQQANDVKLVGFENAQRFLENQYRSSSEDLIDNEEIKLIAPEPVERSDFNRMWAEIGDAKIGMTRWSFGQLATLAKAPGSYVRTLPAQIAADAVMWGLMVHRRDTTVKTYHDPVNGLRAMTGANYGRVPDHEVVEAAASICGNGWEPAEDHMGFRLSDRGLQMFLIDKSRPISIGARPDGRGDRIVYRGVRFRNSEVGGGALSVEGFTFDRYCLNGCIFGLGDRFTTKIRHTKNAPIRWAAEVQPALEAYANSSEKSFQEAIEATQQAKVADDDDQMVDWLARRDVSRKRARDVLEAVEREEGHKARTVFDAVQGLTAIARSIPTVDQRSELEEQAGKLMTKVAALA